MPSDDKLINNTYNVKNNAAWLRLARWFSSFTNIVLVGCTSFSHLYVSIRIFLNRWIERQEHIESADHLSLFDFFMKGYSCVMNKWSSKTIAKLLLSYFFSENILYLVNGKGMTWKMGHDRTRKITEFIFIEKWKCSLPLKRKKDKLSLHKKKTFSRNRFFHT